MAEEATPFLGALHPTETISRARRDLQLRQQALKAYGYRCALTGVKQASPFGTHEVECCHFVPVAVGGANVIQNVILICRTFHWLMDNFLISREDDFRIIWKSTLDRRYVKWLNRSGYACRGNRLFVRRWTPSAIIGPDSRRHTPDSLLSPVAS